LVKGTMPNIRGNHFLFGHVGHYWNYHYILPIISRPAIQFGHLKPSRVRRKCRLDIMDYFGPVYSHLYGGG